MPSYVGIDLGTTFSAVSMLDDTGRPVIVHNRDGENITPSCVLVDGAQMIVGDLEQQMAAGMGEAMVREVAAEIGVSSAATCPYADLISAVKKRKVEFSVALSRRLEADATLVEKMPPELVAAIRGMRGLK